MIEGTVCSTCQIISYVVPNMPPVLLYKAFVDTNFVFDNVGPWNRVGTPTEQQAETETETEVIVEKEEGIMIAVVEIMTATVIEAVNGIEIDHKVMIQGAGIDLALGLRIALEIMIVTGSIAYIGNHI